MEPFSLEQKTGLVVGQESLTLRRGLKVRAVLPSEQGGAADCVRWAPPYGCSRHLECPSSRQKMWCGSVFVYECVYVCEDSCERVSVRAYVCVRVHM